jgi:hypothetical protein
METELNSAALFINNSLVSQGFLRDSERLKFGETENPVGADAENERKIINVIYGLLNKIERDSKEREASTANLKEQQREYERETAKIARLTAKNDAGDKQLQSVEQLNNALESSLASAKKNSDEARAMVAQLKLVVQKSRLQFANELRKRDMEISRLKERLQDPRKVKTISGVSGTLSTSYNSFKGNVNGVASGQVNTSGTIVSNGGAAKDKSAVQRELISMNQQLVSENSTLLEILHSIQDDFISMVYSSSLIDKLPGLHLDGPPDAAGVTQRAIGAKELGKRISICIQEVGNIIHSPNFVSLTELREKEKEVVAVKEELRDMTANWKKAIKTLEEWKKYKEKRDKPWNIRPDSSPRVSHGKEVKGISKSPVSPIPTKSPRSAVPTQSPSRVKVLSGSPKGSDTAIKSVLEDDISDKDSGSSKVRKDGDPINSLPIDNDKLDNDNRNYKSLRLHSAATASGPKLRTSSTLLTPTKASQMRRSENLRNRVR